MDIAKDSETRARLVGVLAQMKTFEYYFGAVVAQLIFKS